MWKLIVIVLLAVGAYFVYENQDELLTSAKEMFLKEKTVMKVNNASAEKQKAIEDATNRALEYYWLQKFFNINPKVFAAS